MPQRRQDGLPVSTARVPKFTVIIGGSYGAGNYGMCGRFHRAFVDVAERTDLGRPVTLCGVDARR
jgi:hypothetical protein